MAEKCKIQKFKLRDFAKLDEVYKRINSRMTEVLIKRAKDTKSDEKTIETKDAKGDIKKVSECDIELVDLMAEAVNGEDLITIVKCGVNENSCKVDELDWDEGLELFKKIVSSEENKDFFLKSYEAKMLAVNPNASLSDSGTLSSSSSERE